MSFVRSTVLRASSFGRCARTARLVRTAELQQPWQRAIQRRSYASAHGSDSSAKKSDLPWAISAVAGTALGLYVVMGQDTGHHEEHHDEAHDKHAEESHEEAPEKEEEKPEEKADEKSEDQPEEKSEEKAEEKSEEKAEEKADEKSEEKPEEKTEEKSEPEPESKSEEKKEDKVVASSKSPDETDPPHPAKPPKSTNEMSGKQEGFSNSDTKHTDPIDNQPGKSKKGEGFAESAKVKGTVSTDRPPVENKEERGKPKMNKDE
ncbi:hypothetical protein DM02DRAFT_672879 [Periconia macrospinosa]|uniref:Cylicin I n=1 Tax=Periconia macrospinosa TaxID=97972 RepID=A0A2V1DM90_9PLEO|nr:hypothetical protein DM02DRAFT_672879 [Periconia macrospinosa]